MTSKRIVLSFPPSVVEQPIIYELITRYDVRIVILRASIDPGKWGSMVMELTGERDRLDKAMKYIQDVGIDIKPLYKEIRHLDDRCTHCTACIPHCPTHALELDRDNWRVSFEAEKCVLCRSCLDACIYLAMEVASP